MASHGRMHIQPERPPSPDECAVSTGYRAIAIGYYALGASDNSVAIGKSASVPSACAGAIAIGRNAAVFGPDYNEAVAIGPDMHNYATGGLMLGRKAKLLAAGDYSIVLNTRG